LSRILRIFRIGVGVEFCGFESEFTGFAEFPEWGRAHVPEILSILGTNP
jgi:hypothetical protein